MRARDVRPVPAACAMHQFGTPRPNSRAAHLIFPCLLAHTLPHAAMRRLRQWRKAGAHVTPVAVPFGGTGRLPCAGACRAAHVRSQFLVQLRKGCVLCCTARGWLSALAGGFYNVFLLQARFCWATPVVLSRCAPRSRHHPPPRMS